MAKGGAGRAEVLEAFGFGAELSPETLAELRRAYLTGVRQDLAALDGLLEDLRQGRLSWPDGVTRLREVVHNIKGQGSSFGFPLMTEIGNSLHLLLRSAPQAALPGAQPVIAAHVACLRRVIEANLEGEGGPKARLLLARLRALTARVTGA